jgi:uncharacterized protein (DUF58 family)
VKTQRLPRVYPTKIFAGLLFVVTVMWYASAAQNNAASYLLLFCTIALVLVSIPHTLFNLAGLKVTTESVKPTFAGQEVSVPVEIVNESRRTRFACVLSLREQDAAAEMIDEVPAGKAARATLRFTARARGEHEIAGIDLRSSYPLGFLAAKTAVRTRQRYIVYPKPEGTTALPRTPMHHRRGVLQTSAREGDDYAGVRGYMPGESQRQIDWKAVARGQPLMTKQFTAEADDVVLLDFDGVSHADREHRLSQLALWIIEAERVRCRYSLHLPETRIPPGSGDAHYHRCLRALALHA